MQQSDPHNMIEEKTSVDTALMTQRKSEHIAICQSQDVESSDKHNGFSHYTLQPRAFPEMSWEDVDTSQDFLEKTFKAPILITGMTGGVEQGAFINKNLALAADRCGIPMGVGSQRVALVDSKYASLFDIKTVAPSVFCIANIGAAQLNDAQAVEHCAKAVKMISADALAIHVNVLQELIQPEGDRNFRGVLAALETIRSKISVPMIVKEVGVGMDLHSAEKLLRIGIDAIDVGGRGGTSWAYIEGLRSQNPRVMAMAKVFRDFGVPTAESLAEIKTKYPKACIIATGGVRDGLTVAKAVGLGATMCGVGLPFFKAALESSDKVEESIRQMVDELKIAMMCTGSRKLSDIAHALRPNALGNLN
jgi:isopentenyl-diphosphate delta-isomerase